MLFNEPKLLKSVAYCRVSSAAQSFSALQRAEIAEIDEIEYLLMQLIGFSALQRAEIAEIDLACARMYALIKVSVLFNEPKLLKYD